MNRLFSAAKLGGLLGALLTLALHSACIATETGNPSIAAGLRARTSDPATASLEPAADRLVVESAWINVTDARVLEGETCDHTRAESAFHELAGDLVAGFEAPEISEPGSCGLHLVFGGAASPPAGAPAALAENALVVTGRRADGARFEIAAPFPHGIDVRAIDARYGETNAALLLTADVAAWFSALDLAAVAPDPDGVVRLGEGDAATLDFERGVSGSLEVFVDANADGALDAAELAAGPIARSGP